MTAQLSQAEHHDQDVMVTSQASGMVSRAYTVHRGRGHLLLDNGPCLDEAVDVELCLVFYVVIDLIQERECQCVAPR